MPKDRGAERGDADGPLECNLAVGWWRQIRGAAQQVAGQPSLDRRERSITRTATASRPRSQSAGMQPTSSLEARSWRRLSCKSLTSSTPKSERSGTPRKQKSCAHVNRLGCCAFQVQDPRCAEHGQSLHRYRWKHHSTGAHDPEHALQKKGSLADLWYVDLLRVTRSWCRPTCGNSMAPTPKLESSEDGGYLLCERSGCSASRVENWWSCCRTTTVNRGAALSQSRRHSSNA